MTASRFLVVGLLAVVVVGLLVVPAGSAAPAGSDDGDEENATEDERGLGADVSAFMQSSSADASEGVDAGLFEARYDRADDRSAVVERRAAALDDRVADLQSEREELLAAYDELDEDELPPGLAAKLTRVTVQLNAFDEAVTQTETRAAEAGVDVDDLATLRANAQALSGPDVAAIATGIAGVNAPGAPADGGPDEVGPPSADDADDDRFGPPIDVPGVGGSDGQSDERAGDGPGATPDEPADDTTDEETDDTDGEDHGTEDQPTDEPITTE